MFIIEKKFDIAIGHRLSKHKGKCKSIHGHNLTILVGIKSEKLDENDMVIDFYDLKQYVDIFLKDWDHSLLINKADEYFSRLFPEKDRIVTFEFDPTSERLAELLFHKLKVNLAMDREEVELDYVTIYETEGSQATYYED